MQTSAHSTQTNTRVSWHQTNDPHVADKLAFRGRGIDKMERRVGPVRKHIEGRLIGGKRKIRLLEIGCGYGVVLMQLRRQFGDRIDLIGTNKEMQDYRDLMLSAAIRSEVYIPDEIHSVRLPTLIQCDVSNGLPFDDCSFDLVVSQMCIQYVPDKVLFLREVARVIRKDGIGMIHTPLGCPGFPLPYSTLLDIWRGGRRWGLRYYLSQRTGQGCLQLGYHSCVHLKSCRDLGTDLQLIDVIELDTIDPSWYGSKSIYKWY